MKFYKIKGFTLLELMIIVTIIATLVLMSSYLLLDVANKAKTNAVKANVASASASLSYKLTSESSSPEELVETVVDNLNNPDGVENSKDELHSPFLKSIEAFTLDEEAMSGQVSILVAEDNNIYVIGYGKNGSANRPIMSRKISVDTGETTDE